MRDAVAREIRGPGKLLGYRAMHRKVRQEHGLNVPRDLVHAVMQTSQLCREVKSETGNCASHVDILGYKLMFCTL